DSGQAGMLEYTGQGLGALEKRMEAKEAQMVVLGAKLLQAPKGSSNQTAESVRAQHAGEHATLRTIANAASLALSQMARWHAWWAGVNAEPIDDATTVGINTDFFEE